MSGLVGNENSVATVSQDEERRCCVDRAEIKNEHANQGDCCRQGKGGCRIRDVTRKLQLSVTCDVVNGDGRSEDAVGDRSRC